MRLRLLTVVGALALALAVPSAALAHHGRGHHRHRAHHARFHFEHIGPSGVSGPTATPSAPTTTPPTTPGPVNAGEVASYDTTTNILVLTLNNKESVSGKVTSDTKIECVTEAAAPTSPTGSEPTGQSPGDDSGQGDDQSRGDTNQQGDEPGQSSGDGQDGSDDDGSTSLTVASEPPCDSTLLKPGTKVRSAELRIGPSGTEFESLVLVR